MDWEIVSFVLSSDLRFRVLLQLRESNLTPTQISNSLGYPLSHISKTLAELQTKELIACLTPARRKGRLFSITQMGNEVLDEVNRITKK